MAIGEGLGTALPKRSFKAREAVLVECLERVMWREEIGWMQAAALERFRGCWRSADAQSSAWTPPWRWSKQRANYRRSGTDPSNLSLNRGNHCPAASVSNSCDGVLCSSVLEYVSDVDTCLKEFARVLRPAGLLLVSVPNRHSIVG